MKKKINVALIIAVVALWGTLGYKVLGNFFGKNDPVNQLSDNKKNVVAFTAVRDTFMMQPLENDPFLRMHLQNKSIIKHSPAKAAPAKHISMKEPKPLEEWPPVEYYGYVKSANNEFALIKVNNAIMKLHKNELKNEIKILAIYKDSVKVSYNKKVRIFTRIIKTD